MPIAGGLENLGQSHFLCLALGRVKAARGRAAGWSVGLMSQEESSWVPTTASTAGELSPTTSKTGHLGKIQGRHVTHRASKGFPSSGSSLKQQPGERLTTLSMGPLLHQNMCPRSVPASTPTALLPPTH